VWATSDLDRSRAVVSTKPHRPRDEMRTILLVDDDPGLLRQVRRYFEEQGWTVFEAEDGSTAQKVFEREGPMVVLLDLQLPDTNGIELLENLRGAGPESAFIMLTGNADLPTAVEAIRRGAENFLAKPISLLHLEAVVERAYSRVRLEQEKQLLIERSAGVPEQPPSSEVMRTLLRQIRKIASTDTTVLLFGETGTGKGWAAERIHSLSHRSRRAFVDINCAGLNSTFLESELFGHEKGAFTDAKTLKRGLLEIADGGTLFLDEVGDMQFDLQPKLLKVVESRRFRRVGGTREITTDVRILAATNRDLEEEARRGRFRSDLFYRLAVFPILLPALRERGSEDLERLVHGLFADLAQRHRCRTKGMSPAFMELLRQHSWPGNVRELRNVLERALIHGDEAVELLPHHLPLELRGQRRNTMQGDTAVIETLAEVERRHILRVLKECGGNRSVAASVMGISRRALYNKLARIRDGAPE
jgi:DNA-binding NtrC family response regulator